MASPQQTRPRRRGPERRRGAAIVTAAVVLAAAGAGVSGADVVRDGSIGVAGPGQVGTAVGPLGGTDYLITEADGARSGNNLFHSFGTFDLTSTERAIYQGSSTIENLITRVTGGPSSIDGVIRSEIPGANLYFLNPAGVIFGENARVDLTGAFYVSTADRLLFDGGDLFETNVGAGATLSVADVAGFGFLDAPAPIRLQGSQLEIVSGGDIGLIGGDLTLEGGRADARTAFLSSQGGRIDFASLASSGEVYVDPGGVLRVENVTARGDVRIADEFTVNSSGLNRDPYQGQFQPPNPGSGAVNVYADDLTMVDADILTLTVTNQDAGDVVLDLDGDLEIRSDNGLRQSGIIAGTGLVDPPGPGDVLDPFLPFLFFPWGSTGTQVLIYNCLSGPCGFAYTMPISPGAAGDVLVRANAVRLLDGGRITARSESEGDAGTITLRVNESILLSGAQASGERAALAGTAEGTGLPGRIVIDSPTATLVMEDGSDILIENSATSSALAAPGEIDIDVASLEMSGDARIDSSTRGAGAGGDIDIVATDFVRITGDGGPGLSAGITSLSQPGSTGRAGNVRIETTNLTLASGAEISARPNLAGGTGDAGNLTFDVANDLVMSGSTISTESPVANGGNIVAFVGRTTRLEQSAITASAVAGSGPGGNVTLTSDPGSVLALSDSRITAEADFGNGGNILIESSLILEGANSRISATSNAGLDGTVIRRAPDGQLIDLSQELALPALDAKALLAEPCAARRPGGANSLVVQASDGLPVDVSAVLPAFLPQGLLARLGGDAAPAAADGAPEEDGLSLAARIDAANASQSCLN